MSTDCHVASCRRSLDLVVILHELPTCGCLHSIVLTGKDNVVVCVARSRSRIISPIDANASAAGTYKIVDQTSATWKSSTRMSCGTIKQDSSTASCEMA